MKQDWRNFLADFEKTHPQDVLHIEQELNPKFEPTALILELERQGRYPVVHFHKIIGSTFPVIANTIATRERLALGIGVNAEDLPTAFAEKIKKALPPVLGENPPFMENILMGEELDLSILPILTHFPIDAGPYITAGLVVAKDPESGADTCGYHRMQFQGRIKLSISLHSGSVFREYHRRAEKWAKILRLRDVLGVHLLFPLVQWL